MHRTACLRALIASTVIPLAIIPVSTFAQETSARQDNVFSSEQDIVVTARRVAENIQSTPVSITAFSADTLRQASIRDTQDLLVKTPGVFLAGSGGRENTNFSIRGQAKALAGNSSAAVISYFAEVPSPTAGSSIPTYDLGSVQVLKGPQGTLFGRNTTGGAILYYPTAPNYTTGGYIQGTYGNYDTRLVEGAINLPIVEDKLALRVAGQIQKRDGWTKNIGIGKDADDLNSRSIRGSLLFEPTDWLSNTTIVDYYRNRSTGGASVLTNVLPGPNGLSATGTLTAAMEQLALQRQRGPRVIDSDVDAFERVNRFGITNRTEIKLGGDTELVSIFGYRHTKVDYFSSVDGLPSLTSDGTGAIPAGMEVMVVGGRQTSDVKQFTQEVQLRGKLLDDKVDWIVGGFYLASDPAGPSGTYIPTFILKGFTDAPFNYNFYSERSKALFANVGYDLGSFAEGLRFNAGFRYTWDDITACIGSGTSSQPQAVRSDCRNGSPLIKNASNNKTSSKAPTWTVGFDWQASKDLFLYAVTRRGYRAGGINGPTLAGRLVPFQSFAPEKVTDIEVGIRSDFNVNGVGVRLNASPFIGWYSGVQVPISGLNTQATCSLTRPGGTDAPYSPDGDCDASNDPAGGTLLVNAGKTRVPGVDLSGRVTPTRTLSFDVGATLLNPKSQSLTVAAPLLPYLRIAEVPFNLVAKTTITAGARWTLPLSEDVGDASLAVDYYHSSKVRSSDNVLPAYDLVNARIDIRKVAGTGLDAGFFMRNVFDKKYLASSNVGSAQLGIMSSFYGAPRTYGIELRYNFGE